MVYDGINEEVSVEENDGLVKFLHPTDWSVYLHWPAFDVKYYMPVNQALDSNCWHFRTPLYLPKKWTERYTETFH